MSNDHSTAKTVLKTLVGLGTGRITYAIINNNVEATEPRVTDKVIVPLASFVIGGMAADAAERHTDKIIDDVVATWKKYTRKNPA